MAEREVTRWQNGKRPDGGTGSDPMTERVVTQQWSGEVPTEERYEPTERRYGTDEVLHECTPGNSDINTSSFHQGSEEDR